MNACSGTVCFQTPTSFIFSLLSETGKSLLAGAALLSPKVLESHYSPNRRGPGSIVGIVVVQCAVIARVANPYIVGVTSVGSAVNHNVLGPRSQIAISPVN